MRHFEIKRTNYEAVVIIKRNPDILFLVRQSFSKRLRKCIDENGGNFEHV